MQLPAPVLAEEVAGAAILLGVLIRDERIKTDRISAHVSGTVAAGDDEDEVVASDVTDEPAFAADPFHDVVQDLGEDANHAIAVVVAVPIVEFLEVIEVGVADGEQGL